MSRESRIRINKVIKHLRDVGRLDNKFKGIEYHENMEPILIEIAEKRGLPVADVRKIINTPYILYKLILNSELIFDEDVSYPMISIPGFGTFRLQMNALNMEAKRKHLERRRLKLEEGAKDE